MTTWTLGALVLVAAGAVVMAIAVWRTIGLLGMLDPQTDLRRWQVLAGLMAFFLAGYAATAALLVVDHPELLVAMVGAVFFGGAVFVLTVVGSTAHTIGLLRAREADLRTSAAEQAAQAAQLGTIVSNLADGLAAIDLECKVGLTNPALLQMLEIEDEAAEGKHIDDILPEELVELLHLCRNSQEALTTEFTLPSKGTGLAVASMIRAADGSCPGCVMLVRDITLAKEVDRMKSDFTAVVSHELRTPLTSVLGFAKLIRNKLERAVFPAVDPEDRKGTKAVEQVRANLDIVLAEGQRLTALINDVLDISKMESGQIEWNMRPLRVREICERAMAATASLFPEDRVVTAVLEVEDDVDDVLGTEDRLIQVLINLISNASKFTDEGQITVAARRLGDAIEFSVTDTGTGIRPADQDKVFERFKQVGDAMSDRPKGTGLGLPICKEIVTHHGGRIWVESAMGRGSRFAFTIPLVTASGLPVDPKDLQNLIQQLRVRVAELPTGGGAADVLVVDDDPALRELLTQQLTEAGYQVRTAADGVAAMQEARAKRPDLIILDVMMPGISGFDVVSMLRADHDMVDVPILILSIVEDTETGYRLGANRYLHKPIDQELLLREIEALIRDQAAHRVLVVADDEANVPALTAMLESSGLEVAAHCTRDEALERTRTLRPDIVLVDAPGPQYDALTKELHTDPDLAGIDVVWLLDAARAAG